MIKPSCGHHHFVKYQWFLSEAVVMRKSHFYSVTVLNELTFFFIEKYFFTIQQLTAILQG